MAAKQNRIVSILVKYALRQELSGEERRILDEWRSRSAEHGALPEQLRDPQWRDAQQQEADEAPSAEMWENIRRHIRANKEREMPVRSAHRYRIRSIWRSRVAAVLFVLVSVSAVLGFVGWLWHERQGVATVPATTKIAPAPLVANLPPATGSGVHIGLHDGRNFDPLQAKPGDTLAKDGTSIITRIRTGVRYTPAPGVVPQTDLINTISIGHDLSEPFELAFADGNQVWFDKATQFAYPIGLRGGPDLNILGQAFFIIAHNDPAHPIRIHTGQDESSEVLGTTFNVQSYDDGSPGKVEVFDGKVRVTKKKKVVIVKPGLAAVMSVEKGLQLQPMGPHDEMPAWMRPPVKGSYFEFRDTPLSVALNEVASWYRKSISNPDSVKGTAVTGKLLRHLPLDNTLSALERVEGGNAFLRSRSDTIFVTRANPGP